MPSIQQNNCEALHVAGVLNLIISGMPSIPTSFTTTLPSLSLVLNLIISGMPSILKVMAMAY